MLRWQVKHRDRAVARPVWLTRAERVVVQKPSRGSGVHPGTRWHWLSESTYFLTEISAPDSPCPSSHVTSLCTGL